MVSVFRRRGNRRALVLAQRLDRQAGVPQIDLDHGDRRLGHRLGAPKNLSRSTDPAMAANFANRVYESGRLKRRFKTYFGVLGGFDSPF